MSVADKIVGTGWTFGALLVRSAIVTTVVVRWLIVILPLMPAMQKYQAIDDVNLQITNYPAGEFIPGRIWGEL